MLQGSDGDTPVSVAGMTSDEECPGWRTSLQSGPRGGPAFGPVHRSGPASGSDGRESPGLHEDSSSPFRDVVDSDLVTSVAAKGRACNGRRS